MTPQEGAAHGTAAAATVGLVLVLVSVALAPAGVALARRLVPGRIVFFARWGFSHVGLAVLAYFALAIGAASLPAIGVKLETPVELVTLGAGLQLATVAVVVSFARRLDPRGARCLGLESGGWGRAGALGVASYLLALPGIAGLMAISSWLWPALGLEAEPQEVLKLVLGLDGVELAYVSFLAVVVVPLFEEVLFRAFLQPLLVQNLGDRGGVVVTALLFAALHANLFAALPIFALALVLGSVMLRTQRLAACWLVHALHNGGMLALALSSDAAREWVGS
jgi:membrane protease YdiL (CAAX protease family)